ncbi:hypothetical protein F4815DRAFT_448717 [Daldinia loculata]|nr:hypothetical protein F4815DRAFT_448717 [Daldinia loculata]
MGLLIHWNPRYEGNSIVRTTTRLLCITGTAVVDSLIKSPEYTEIYTLSRSLKYSEHPKVKHATLDLQSSAEDMSKSLSHIPPVTHIYFCAYLANPDEGEASRINGSMQSNFLEALIKSGQTRELEYFSLTCGFKQYGRVLAWGSLAVLDVIGLARANFMNLATSFGLYCAVSKELEGSKLVFPGNEFKQPSELFCQIDLEKWAKRPEVIKAWETLRDRYNLDQAAWDGATWGFLGFLCTWPQLQLCCEHEQSTKAGLDWIC